MRDRVRHLKGAQVSDHRPGAVGIYLRDAVEGAKKSVRATGAGDERIERPVSMLVSLDGKPVAKSVR